MALTIARRFCGPPASGNGGYSCGRVAALVGQIAGAEWGAVHVRLASPPPLDRPMAIRSDGGVVTAFDGDTLVATGKVAALDLAVPAAPSWEEATAAQARYIGHTGHFFPTCFVCGPARAPGDGLRIFAGLLGDGRVAAPFSPPMDLVRDGHVPSEIVWAALDCPGYFAIVADRPEVMLLGELSLELRAPVPAAESWITYGWPLERQGRKARCGTALASADGQIVAVALATWIAIA